MSKECLTHNAVSDPICTGDFPGDPGGRCAISSAYGVNPVLENNPMKIVSYSIAIVSCLAVAGNVLANNTTDPVGACCHTDATYGFVCTQETMQDCQSMPNGIWYGANVNCSAPGVECDPLGWGACHVAAGMNCAGRPDYVDPDFAQVFGDGQIAVQTAAPSILGGFVVTVFDLSDADAAPLDSWWGLNRYSHLDWNKDVLGSIYGLAVDDDGDIFVTATKSWNSDHVGIGGWGAVYRLDRITGGVSVFATLPNNGSGLGNITWDCVHQSFYVSNFEDGMIYHLDPNGNILGTFDPGNPWNGQPGPVAQGDRPFAVEVHNARLYYSMWNEHLWNGNATTANEIWSVQINGMGTPIGAEQLEVTLPAIGNYDWSAPVGDMRFSPEGTMLLAERSMNSWTTLSAHDSRVLEYECDGYGWVPSTNTFGVGEYLVETNATGGVDADGKRVWAAGDALHLSHPQPHSHIYGFQGLPSSGGSVSDSVIVDYQDLTNSTDKTMLGDLVVTKYIEEPCVETHVSSSDCKWNHVTGFYHQLNFGFSNMGPLDIMQVELTLPAGVTASPTLFHGPFPAYHSYPLTTNLYGASVGQVCIELTVTRMDGTTCNEEICFTIPSCGFDPGDVNFDHAVDIVDLLMIIEHWGDRCSDDSDCVADQDGDSLVGIGDLLVVLENWSS